MGPEMEVEGNDEEETGQGRGKNEEGGKSGGGGERTEEEVKRAREEYNQGGEGE